MMQNTAVTEPKSLKSREEYKKFRKDFLAKRPGYLTNQGTLTLKTRIAQYQFLHLLPFISKVNAIYKAAAHDDPYADFYLLKVESALLNTKTFFQKKIEEYRKQIPNSHSLQIQLVDTNNPLVVPVYLNKPYARLVFNLLTDLDELACCVISLKMLGTLDKSVSEILRIFGKRFRKMLAKPNDWHVTGVTRKDIQQNTDIAQQAEKLMKKLDSRILARSIKAKFAPAIVNSTQNLDLPNAN